MNLLYEIQSKITLKTHFYAFLQLLSGENGKNSPIFAHK